MFKNGSTLVVVAESVGCTDSRLCFRSFSCLHVCDRQRSELEDLRRQLEENSRLAERALREELEKSREEQEKRHQVITEQSQTSYFLSAATGAMQEAHAPWFLCLDGGESVTRTSGHGKADVGRKFQEQRGLK